jgi:hypothetical protein
MQASPQKPLLRGAFFSFAQRSPNSKGAKMGLQVYIAKKGEFFHEVSWRLFLIPESIPPRLQRRADWQPEMHMKS